MPLLRGHWHHSVRPTPSFPRLPRIAAQPRPPQATLSGIASRRVARLTSHRTAPRTLHIADVAIPFPRQVRAVPRQLTARIARRLWGGPSSPRHISQHRPPPKHTHTHRYHTPHIPRTTHTTHHTPHTHHTHHTHTTHTTHTTHHTPHTTHTLHTQHTHHTHAGRNAKLGDLLALPQACSNPGFTIRRLAGEMNG